MVLRLLFVLVSVLGLSLLPVTPAFAQDATVAGIIVDESKAVLPGVTVSAVAQGTGRTHEAVTNERGEYRLLGLAPGRYTLKAELAGFSTLVLENIELLVGQNANVPFTLKLASLQETVTVSSESPLVDLRASQVSGNVDRRQMEELPIHGRNWMELSTMIKGITANTANNTPGVTALANFQLNLDGQEITQQVSVTGFGQPGISREAIAEYQVVTNMFDVTSGRSAGIQVQAISRSGTNDLAGSVYGYFRDESLNAADAFLDRVLPYSNRQVGATVGGPITRDRMHYFVSYEREREPNTAVIAPNALAPQTITLPVSQDKDMILGRFDAQIGTRDHLVVRGNYFKRFLPSDGVQTHPSRGTRKDIRSEFAQANWSRVGSAGLLHEFKAGWYRYYWIYTAMEGLTMTPEYSFPGLTLGLNWNYPEWIYQERIPLRYDMTWNKGGHELKIGGEWLIGNEHGEWPARSRGQYFFRSLPPDAARRFPLDQDPSAWDFSGLDSTVIRFDQTYGQDWTYYIPRKTYGAWIGDTWKVNGRLTLNLGVRYDLAWGDFSPPNVQATDLIIDNGLFVENVGYDPVIRDINNVAPRIGFTLDPVGQGKTVIRGGVGLFYGHIGANPAVDQQLWNAQRTIFNSYVNDGQPSFIADPTRGVTADDVLSGRVPLAPQSISIIERNIRTPYTWQAILGFQKQLSDIIGVDADLTYIRGYHQESQRDPNLFYDPATGLSKNPSVHGRPRPDFGPIRLLGTNAEAERLQLSSSVTRRYRNNFQLGATYTLMFFNDDSGIGGSGYGNDQINPFDIGYNWARSADFQRHTFRANGIWHLPYGVSLTGLYRFGSGNYGNISSGFNLLGGPGSNRFRRDGSFIPLRTFKLDPHQALDLRVSKDFALGRGLKLAGIAEVFNVFNYKRYNYNLLETSPTFGRRVSSDGLPRSAQLAFRLTF
jgi:hypothetical protein